MSNGKHALPFFWILKKIKKRLPALFAMVAANVGHSLLAVGFALGTRGVIDSAVSGDAAAFRDACLVQAEIILGILLCTVLVRHLREKLRADLERDWKRQLLHGLLHGDYMAVSQYHSAELLNRLNNDVSKVNEGILSVVPGAASMVTRLLSAVVVLGALDGQFTLLVLSLGCLVILATGLMRRRLKELNKQVSQQDGRVSGFLQETLEKLLMVQAMDISREVETRADALMAERYAIQKKRKNVSLLSNTAVNILYYGAGFLALCWCAWRMLLGQMSFGSLTAITQLVSQLQTPFVNLSAVVPQYLAMAASAERLMELDALEQEPASREQDAAGRYSALDAIRGEHLTFSYGRDVVLENAEFTLPKGSFAVVTGPSGTGKSTLLKLLLGIFPPEAGRLYLRGDEEIPCGRGTRGLFAYVPQGNLLFSGTLRENLTIVRPDATEEEIALAVRISCMDSFLPQLPQGLDTVLSENGGGLSEGQGQRIAIARGILTGAPVLLLDECTSALDAETEKTVLQRLRTLPGRTVLAVTHRQAAVELADVQLEIRDGKIRTVTP